MLIERLRGVGVTFNMVRHWLASDLRAPTHAMNKLRSLASFWNDAKERSFARSGSFPIGASECLTLAPALRHWLHVTKLEERLPLEVASFCALADVVGLLQKAKNGAKCSRYLEAALRAHGIAFQAAYGTTDQDRCVSPKHIAQTLSNRS